MEKDEHLVASIHQILGNIMLRRTKAEVLHLPAKTIRDVWLPASPMTVEYIKLIYKAQQSDPDNSASASKA